MKNSPKEEILLQPQFSFLEFGDGLFAQMKPGSIEYKDGNGFEWIELIIQPGEKLIKKYNIKSEELDINNNYTIKLKKIDLIPLNIFDDTNRIFLYTKDFRGEETVLSKRDWELTHQVEEYQNKLEIIEAWMIAKSEELMLSETNATQYFAGMLELFNKIQGMGISNLINPKQEATQNA